MKLESLGLNAKASFFQALKAKSAHARDTWVKVDRLELLLDLVQR